MLKLIITADEPNKVVVVGRTPEVGVYIDQVTRFKPLNYERTDKYKAGTWDGFKRMFNKWTGTFPIGLLDDVEIQLLIQDVDYEIIDKRTFAPSKQLRIRYKSDKPLRDYQKEAIKTFLRKKRGIISLPCGTGKTKVGEAVIGFLKRPAVFYVGRKELLWDTVKTFKKNLGIPIGVVGDGKVDIKPVTVATVQTVTNLPNRLFTDFDVAIFDECHHVAAETVFDIAKKTTSEYVMGLSATPAREDGCEMLIFAGTGPVIFKKSTTEMIEAGYLARPDINAIDVLPIPFTRRDKWADVYSRGVVHNRQRNNAITAVAVDEAQLGKVYVHVNQIPHGQILEKMINKLSKDSYIKAKFICGTTKKKERQKVLEDFRDGDLRILVSTLLGEGVDIPKMYCLILAAGGKSKVSVQQVLGRLLRISEHDMVKFYDCTDPFKYCYDHFLERVRYYQSESAYILNGTIATMRI